MTKFITVSQYAISYTEATLIAVALNKAFISEKDEKKAEQYLKLSKDWDELRYKLAWDANAILEIPE